MKHLWAPWRTQYILGPREPGCVFCFEPDQDDERHVLVRSSSAFVIMNKYPYSNGHLLVVPRRHVARPWQLPAEEYRQLCSLLLESMQVVQQALQPHGMNVGMNMGQVAGAGVDEHMHFHIVPRWSGDHNYMSVLGEVRVINQHLEETWRLLKQAFERG
ncbi:MAG: HIT family hydrolase [Deltaproteobacteria bacterium]|nr:MAG: HIT family hydrolase [Deltaproteobacteria bacterium]